MNLREYAKQRFLEDPTLDHQQVLQEYQEANPEPDYVVNDDLIDDMGSAVAGGFYGGIESTVGFGKSFLPKEAQDWMNENIGLQDYLGEQADRAYQEYTPESKRALEQTRFTEGESYNLDNIGQTGRAALLIGSGGLGSLGSMAVTGGPVKGLIQTGAKRLAKKYGDDLLLNQRAMEQAAVRLTDPKTGTLRKGVGQKELDAVAEGIKKKLWSKEVGSKIEARATEAGYGIAGGAMSGGSVYDEVDETIRNEQAVPLDVLMQHPEFQKLERKHGAEVARELFATDQAERARNIAAPVGAVSGALTGRIMGDIFKYSGKKFVPAVALDTTKEGLTEFGQGAAEAAITKAYIPGSQIDILERGVQEGIGGIGAAGTISVGARSAQNLSEVVRHSADSVFDRGKQFAKTLSPLTESDPNKSGSILKNLANTFRNEAVVGKLMAGQALSDAEMAIFGDIPITERVEILGQIAKKAKEEGIGYTKAAAKIADKELREKYEQALKGSELMAKQSEENRKRAESYAEDSNERRDAMRLANIFKRQEMDMMRGAEQVLKDAGVITESHLFGVQSMIDDAKRKIEAGGLSKEELKFEENRLAMAQAVKDVENKQEARRQKLDRFEESNMDEISKVRDYDKFRKDAESFMRSEEAQSMNDKDLDKGLNDLIQKASMEQTQADKSFVRKVGEKVVKTTKDSFDSFIAKVQKGDNQSNPHSLKTLQDVYNGVDRNDKEFTDARDWYVNLEDDVREKVNARITGEKIGADKPYIETGGKSNKEIKVETKEVDAFKKKIEQDEALAKRKQNSRALLDSANRWNAPIQPDTKEGGYSLNVLQGIKEALRKDRKDVPMSMRRTIEMLDEDSKNEILYSDDLTKIKPIKLKEQKIYELSVAEKKSLAREITNAFESGSVEEDSLLANAISNLSVKDLEFLRSTGGKKSKYLKTKIITSDIFWTKGADPIKDKAHSKRVDPNLESIGAQQIEEGFSVQSISERVAGISKKAGTLFESMGKKKGHQLKMILDAAEAGDVKEILSGVLTKLESKKKKSKRDKERILDIQETLDSYNSVSSKALDAELRKVAEEIDDARFDRVLAAQTPVSNQVEDDADSLIASKSDPLKDRDGVMSELAGKVELDYTLNLPSDPRVSFITAQSKTGRDMFLNTNDPEIEALIERKEDETVPGERLDTILNELNDSITDKDGNIRGDAQRTFSRVPLDEAIKTQGNGEAWTDVMMIRAARNARRGISSKRYKNAVETLYQRYLSEAAETTNIPFEMKKIASRRLMKKFSALRTEDIQGQRDNARFDALDIMNLGDTVYAPKRVGGVEVGGDIIIDRRLEREPNFDEKTDVRTQTQRDQGFVPLKNGKVLNLPLAVYARMNATNSTHREAVQSVLGEYIGRFAEGGETRKEQLKYFQTTLRHVPTKISYDKEGKPFSKPKDRVGAVVRWDKDERTVETAFLGLNWEQAAKIEALQKEKKRRLKELKDVRRLTQEPVSDMRLEIMRINAEIHKAAGLTESQSITKYEHARLTKDKRRLEQQLTEADANAAKTISKDIDKIDADLAKLPRFNKDTYYKRKIEAIERVENLVKETADLNIRLKTAKGKIGYSSTGVSGHADNLTTMDFWYYAESQMELMEKLEGQLESESDPEVVTEIHSDLMAAYQEVKWAEKEVAARSREQSADLIGESLVDGITDPNDMMLMMQNITLDEVTMEQMYKETDDFRTWIDNLEPDNMSGFDNEASIKRIADVPPDVVDTAVQIRTLKRQYRAIDTALNNPKRDKRTIKYWDTIPHLQKGRIADYKLELKKQINELYQKDNGAVRKAQLRDKLKAEQERLRILNRYNDTKSEKIRDRIKERKAEEVSKEEFDNADKAIREIAEEITRINIDLEGGMPPNSYVSESEKLQAEMDSIQKKIEQMVEQMAALKEDKSGVGVIQEEINGAIKTIYLTEKNLGKRLENERLILANMSKAVSRIEQFGERYATIRNNAELNAELRQDIGTKKWKSNIDDRAAEIGQEKKQHPLEKINVPIVFVNRHGQMGTKRSNTGADELIDIKHRQEKCERLRECLS